MFPAVVFLECCVATCLIGLGANQGDRAANLAVAVAQLSSLTATRVLRVSHNRSTSAAIGGGGQDDFLNAALTLETSLTPRQCLQALRGIEDQLGRQRGQRWAPRAIDLDLLLYDDLVVSAPDLVLPHPRMAYRRFVLEPSAEVAPDFIHPTTQFSIAELLARLDKTPRRIAIPGASGQQNNRLARLVAENTTVHLAEDPTGGELSNRLAALLAGPSCQTAIEFIDRQRDHVQRVRLAAGGKNENTITVNTEADVTIVHSSWLGEGHALARLVLSPDALSEFERYWNHQRIADELCRTTLVVVLLFPDAPAGDAPAGTLPRDASLNKWIAPLQAEIKRLALVPRQSPWLQLDASDPDWARTEVVAAIEAMQ